jgi:hypothetical protein
MDYQIPFYVPVQAVAGVALVLAGIALISGVKWIASWVTG